MTSSAPPPVTTSITPPTVTVDVPTIDYPTIKIPAQVPNVGPKEEKKEKELPPVDEELVEEFTDDDREMKDDPPSEPKTETPSVDTPTPQAPVITQPTPTINIGGVEAPLPEAAPLITAGATAVVTTTVTLGATILMGKVKDLLIEPAMKRASASRRKKKIKIKQVKPVIHYVLNEDNTIDILEYSQTGTKVIGQTDDVERYIRDQVEIDSLYELDNKVIIDDVIKEQFTKEGAKRFKSLFAPAKSIAKKLGAKFSI